MSVLKGSSSLQALCLCLFSVSALSFSFKELKVTAASYTTNVTTAYTVLYDRTITNSFTSTAFASTPLSASSTVTLTFPIQYSLTSNITCSYQINSTGSFIANSCSQLNNQITLSGLFTAGQVLANITLLVGNVLNPYPAGKTSNFTGTIGSDVSVANGVNSLVTITAAASACSFTFSPNLVYSTANMIFSLTVTNQFPSSGTIQVQFPLTRLWSQELDSTRLLPISSSMVCGNQSSGVNSAIQCSGSTSFAIVTFSNVVSASLAPGSTISFSVSNFYAPPTNQPADAITVTTFTGSSSIDACSAYVTGLIPQTIPSSQFFISEINNEAMVVNGMYTIKFAITTLSVISLTDYFIITFPTGTSINNFATASLGGTVGFNQASSTYYSQVLTLYMLGTGTLQPGQIFITISNFVAPPSTQITPDFQFQIVSNNFPKMVSYQTIQATTGAVSGSAAMTVSTVNAVTSYSFSITLSNLITSSGYFKLTFPSILSVANSSSCAVITGTFMASVPQCYYNPIDNSITLTALNTSSNNIPAQTFSMVVSGVTNPPSTATTPAFTLTTYYNSSSAAAVDSGSIPGVTATPATIDHTKISVLSSSFVTSDTSVSYSLSFVVQNPIPVGGYIVLYYPTSLYFDLTVANSNCQLALNSSAPASTPCTAALAPSAYLFNFSNPFPSSGAAASTNVTLTVLNAATNPPTTQPISPFSIETFYSDGSAIANAYNVSTYTKVTVPSSFSLNQVSKASNQNGAYTSFTVTLNQIATLEANAVILVTFPSSLQPQSTSTCSIAYQSAGGTVACGLTGSTFKVIGISSAVIAGTSFSITFTNIRSALSFSPISGFVVTTKTATNLYFYSSGTSTGSVTNTLPSQFTSLSYLYTPQQLNASVSLQLSFQLSQYSLMPGYLQVSIDSYFSVSGLSCSAFIDFAGNCTPISSNTLKITGSFNDSVMGFTITGFSSQSYVPPSTTYSVLNTFDASGFKMDESANNITFFIGCSLPCMTCSTSNSSYCLTCYSSSLVTAALYYHSATNYCYATCPATTYNSNASLTCAACSSNCLHCLASASYCTKCVPNSTFPYLAVGNGTQSCVAQCASGYYPDSSLDPTTCVACKSPCATCSSAVVCLSCVSGYYFLGNTTCTTSCTNFTTIPNNSTHVCDPCSAICLTCVGTVDTCTACASPLVYYNGSCQSGCPAGGTLAPYLGICTPCNSNCVTCSNVINNCTSCALSSSYPFLVNNTCIASCPDYYYNQSSTGTCFSCVSAAINCRNCSSVATCYSCDTAYLLHNSQCINYVPTGYVNMSGVAVACSGDCATCSLLPSNCTSCRNYSLQGFSCVASCATGTISVSSVCVACLSPCLTCSLTQSNCTACLTTLSPPLFLSINTCQATCPSQFYPNSLTFQCSACTNNCLLCSSATECLSCSNGTSLYNTSCLATCPAGYTGISGVCQLCTSNCKTCSGGTNICLTCNPNTYYISSSQSCAATCNSSNLFVDYVSQACVGCAASCASCVNTSSTCTSCAAPALLYASQCVANCPTGMFASSGACAQCLTACSACYSLSNCSGCAGTAFLYNGQCVSSCPSTSGYVLNGQCTACTGNACYSCSSADVCLSCKSSYLYLNALCISSADGCPSGYTSNGTHCNDALSTALSSGDSSPNRSFPVPFTIAGVILVIACLMSRLQFHETYLSGAIYALVALLEWGALWLFLYLYFVDYMAEPVAEYIGLGAMAFLYVMNIVASIAQGVFLSYEKEFVGWTQQSKFNKCFYWSANAVGLLVTHKFRNILFCKLFTFRVFCAKLDSVQHFRIFNIFSLVSLVHSGAAIFAAGIALTKTTSKQQLFHECIDVIVLTALNVAMAFFNTHKDPAFFEETTPEGYSLHKKNSAIEEHLVGARFNELGEDGEVEEGFTTGFNHALTSKQALKFDKISEESLGEVGGAYSDSSLADLSEKCYEEISVQALDLIDEKMDRTAKTKAAPPSQRPACEEASVQADELLHEQEQRGIDLSALPPHDSSAFTAYDYFQKVDRSVQGNLDRGVSFAVQFQGERQDESVQNGPRLGDMVDCSVQKSEALGRNDCSVQRSEGGVEASVQKGESWAAVEQSAQYSGAQRDASFQYSGDQRDESVAMSRHARSFGAQLEAATSEKSVSARPSVRHQSNQLSVISQEDEEVQMEPEVEERGIQPTVQFEDEAVQQELSFEDYGVQPELEYQEVAVQPTLDPSNNEAAVQYSLEEPPNYNEFEEELARSHSHSDVLFDPSEETAQGARELQAEKAEALEVENQHVRSYQEELEERIRHKEKELLEIKRKIDFKERMNEKKKEELMRRQDIAEEDIELQGIQYVEQRPQPIPTLRPSPTITRKASSNHSRTIQEIQVKREPEYSIEHFDLEIESKQIPKETPPPPSPPPPHQENNNSSASGNLSGTIEEIKIVKEVPEDMPSKNRRRREGPQAQPVQEMKQSVAESRPSIRERTIEEIRYEDNASLAHSGKEEVRVEERAGKEGFIESRPEYTRRREQEKKQIEYKEYANELLSEEEAEDNRFVRSSQLPTPKQSKAHAPPPAHNQPSRHSSPPEKPPLPSPPTNRFLYEEMNDHLLPQEEPELPRKVEVRDMGNLELQTGSQHEEQIRPEREEGSLEEERQQLQVEERSQDNRESEATKKNYYGQRRNVVIDVTEIDQSLRGEEDYAELEENESEPEPAGIAKGAYHAKPHPRAHSPSDLSGTIEEIPRHPGNDEKTVSNKEESPKRQGRAVEAERAKLASYFAESVGRGERGKGREMPREEGEQFRITRLYSNNDPLRRNEEPLPRNAPRERKSTLAMAGKAHFAEEKLAQKKSAPRNPLEVGRPWEAQREDRSVSEEEEAHPSLRNNLVRKPNGKHLQNFASHLVLPQETDQQDTSFKPPRREERAPMSGKLREVRPAARDLEEIEVHFESDLSRDLSLKNRSPEAPRGGGKGGQSGLGGSSIDEDESEDVDYRRLMLLGQMQPRPGNGDLQEYYQRKDSKERRRKSNSRIDRSTEKIYMQKLDKGKR